MASSSPSGRSLSHRWVVLRRFRHCPTALIGLGLTSFVVLLGAFADRIAPSNPFTTSAPDRLGRPSSAHLMGTDQLGRDIFTWVVRGARTSLSLVVGVVAIAAVIGVVVGAASGLRGGLLDDVVLRISETVQSVPRFFLAVLVAGWFGAGGRTFTVLLGLTSWPFLARVVRAEALSLREREFVDAARSVGASDLRILVRHIIPNVLNAAVVVLALTASRVVLLEAGLAFLGLSDPNVPSWGALINNAQPYLARAWWMSVFPGGAISIAVLGVNLLADGLNDVLNPLQSGGTTGSGELVGAPSLRG